MTTQGIFKEARSHLKGNWGLAIGVTVLASLITGAASGISFIIPFAGWVVPILFGFPLATSISWIFLAFIDKDEQPTVGSMFAAFNQYGRVVLATFLRALILFAWGLLYLVGLVIVLVLIFVDAPGVIITISLLTLILLTPMLIFSVFYSQLDFILKDNPELPAADALKRSRQLMQGHFWKYFGIQLLLGLILSIGVVPMLIGIVLLLLAGINSFLFGDLVAIGTVLTLLGALLMIPAIIFATPFMHMVYATFYRRLVPKKVMDSQDAFEGEVQNI